MIDKIRERLKKRIAENRKYISTNFRDVNNQIIGLKKAIDIINQVEAEYNNGWIYCSSGQIPKDDDYILYCGNHLANMEVDCCIGEWFLNHLEYMLAWQPLPQPPKGECWKNEEDIS